MTSATGIETKQFQAATLYVPSAVLVAQIQALQNGTATALELLLQNPPLLLQVVQQRELFRTTAGVKQAAEILAGLDLAWLESLIQHQALRQSLEAEVAPSDVEIWQRLRLQIILVQELATLSSYPNPVGAAVAAIFGNAGLLLLEQQHGSDWAQLLTQTTSVQNLLNAEHTRFGITHHQSAINLLEAWQIDSSLLDTVRYQNVTVLEVRDASTLVRLVWMARQLAAQLDTPDESLVASAQQVLELGSISVQALVKRAREKLRDEARQLNLQQLLHSKGEADEIAELNVLLAQNQQRQLRQMILDHSTYMALQHEPVVTSKQLQELLVAMLRQAGIVGGFVVLAETPEQGYCRILVQHQCELARDEFTIRCEPGRSALATAVLSQSLTTLAQDSRHLTVVDRQFMQALGGAGLMCEPVSTQYGRAALLIAATAPYAAQTMLRQLIRSKLAEFLNHQAPTTAQEPGDTTPQYQKQIQETVHEINNPLSIIRNYLQLYAMKPELQINPVEMRQLNAEIERISNLLLSMREVRKDGPVLSSCDLNAVVTGLGSVLRSAFAGQDSQKIELRLNCAASPLPVEANPDALKQILTNLVKNAAEALPGGGLITLSTLANVYFRDQLYSQLIVADNGAGIIPERMQTLFIQMASDKGGMHSGSGLSIVKRLMDEMQGMISCQSDSNGTVFTILLPQAK